MPPYGEAPSKQKNRVFCNFSCIYAFFVVPLHVFYLKKTKNHERIWNEVILPPQRST